MDEPQVKMAPLRRQYLQIKQRFPDVILLFRLGDFYETFEDDAKIASSVLDIVLTSREMGKGVRVPLAGIPYHAAEGYIARLIAAGHKVAICEQLGDPATSKGLVDRDVTRVVTPGTVTEPSMLPGSRNNFIASVMADGKRAGIAWADVTTGEFAATELSNQSDLSAAITRELTRLGPAEVVLRASEQLPDWLPESITASPTEGWHWRPNRTIETLQRHFGVGSLEGFGLSAQPMAIAAAGALIDYLAETQGSGLQQITTIRSYSVTDFMTLDPQTVRNLELHESSRGDKRSSLTGVLDQTRTPMGSRLIRRWISQPLLDVAALEARLDGVQELHDDGLRRGQLREILGKIGDIERLANRAVTNSAMPRELAALRESLQQLPGLAPFTTEPAIFTGLADTHALLSAALVDEPAALLGKDQAIRPGYAAELDGHRARAREAREWIANLERQERERTGIKSLKVGYNRVFGYYLEVTTAALAAAERELLAAGEQGSPLPADYIPKQTLVNATRYFTPQLKEYETVLLTAEEILKAMEAGVYRQICAEVASAAPRLMASAAEIARLDTLASLAEVAVVHNYVRPVLDERGVLAFAAARHPVLETTLPPGEFVANDVRLDQSDQQIVVLTGPNMAGKSSFLRQVALITLMAQIGSFVPATEARIGIVDRIFTRIGAQDDIATGQSTFMVEMLETANILNNATRNSLVVLDEIGRGTSTYDGLAIARAVVEYLHNSPALGCKTLFATHYHELTELEEILPRVHSWRVDVSEEGERIVFLRKVVAGGADRSYGVHVAELAGIPKPVVRRAREVLAHLEADPRGADNRRSAMAATADQNGASIQFTLFGDPDPVVEALKTLDVDALSPLDALTKLYELKRAAGTSEVG